MSSAHVADPPDKNLSGEPYVKQLPSSASTSWQLRATRSKKRAHIHFQAGKMWLYIKKKTIKFLPSPVRGKQKAACAEMKMKTYMISVGKWVGPSLQKHQENYSEKEKDAPEKSKS